jgi:hypothetical protein
MDSKDVIRKHGNPRQQNLLLTLFYCKNLKGSVGHETR